MLSAKPQDTREMPFMTLVHPEHDGEVLIMFHENSWRGLVRYKGQQYEAELHDLLDQGWEVFETKKLGWLARG